VRFGIKKGRLRNKLWDCDIPVWNEKDLSCGVSTLVFIISTDAARAFLHPAGLEY